MEGRVGQLIIGSVGPRALDSEDSAQIGAASKRGYSRSPHTPFLLPTGVNGGGMQEQY